MSLMLILNLLYLNLYIIGLELNSNLYLKKLIWIHVNPIPNDRIKIK